MERSVYRSAIIVITSLIGIVLIVFLMLLRPVTATENAAVCDISKSAFCIAPRTADTVELIHGATIPKIATPAWLQAPQDTARIVQYSVETRGNVTADVDEFISNTNQTLNDSRGWSRLGIRFERVESGGDFTLVLSEASQMTTFSANGCDTTYSCNVGRFVVINQDRWIGATPSWTGGGGDLATYRQMVVNHETGHWLGHGHSFCSAAGQPATVMQQQSMNMQGCTPNPWPLQSEMYAPTLGIRS